MNPSQQELDWAQFMRAADGMTFNVECLNVARKFWDLGVSYGRTTCKQSMSTTTPHPKADANGWIKFSDAVPKNFNEVLLGAFFNGLFCIKSGLLREEEEWRSFSHWRPCDLPQPVAKKSPHEIDHEAHLNWAKTAGVTGSQDIWRAALAWERSRKEKQT